MNFNVEVRKKQLQSLDQCITSFKDKVDSILGYLGWTAKRVLENDDRTLCPINSGHTIQLESIVPHVERCRLTSSGYSLTETFLSEPSSDPKSSICLNNHEKIEVLNKVRSVNPRFMAAWNGNDPDPRTSDRLFSTYSTDERLALYNNAVEHTQGPPVLSEFDMKTSL
ncbi:unnamed protein product [Callosobruchus maculatus]|uniref:CHHC U11-48K-type domain-containing protein n=1 Tax=Callosobruchus maculatus TaxID=64391 RepID=A0A653CZX2_CALMS|nr:unnamed protein product [Callosobruchus maculatus]